MSGLIYKVVPATTVAWQRQTGAMFLCVCTRKDVCLCPSLSVWLNGLPGQWQHWSYMILHREGIEFSLISPKEINTHNSSASCRLSLKNSVQAQYGNVVKWPTGITDRIRPQKLGSQADFPASEFRYILPVFQNAGCGTYMFPLNIHSNVRWPCLLYVRISLCMFALDTESVEWERESSPSHLAVVLIGCALLTGCWQSTSHRQVLCFSPFHLQGLWKYFL